MVTNFFGVPFFETHQISSFQGLILSAYALVAKPSKLSAELHQRIEAARTG